MRLLILLAIIFITTGCAAWTAGPTLVPAVPPTLDPQRLQAPPAPIPQAGTNRRLEMQGIPQYGLILGFDSISPIYEPKFIAAEETSLAEEELILGVAWGGEAKAYPINVLNSREMVNDELAGVPILVSW